MFGQFTITYSKILDIIKILAGYASNKKFAFMEKT